MHTAAAATIGRPALDKAWPWPDPRLSYANAVLPEALLAAGRWQEAREAYRLSLRRLRTAP